MVAEVEIPNLKISKDPNSLEQCKIIQPFADVTEGLIKTIDGGELGGLVVHKDQLYWTVRDNYNGEGEDNLSHGRSNLDFKNLYAKGLWHLGAKNKEDRHSYKNAGYMLEMPQNLTDYVLASGMQARNTNTKSSFGPSLYGFNPPLTKETTLNSECYFWYPKDKSLKNHKQADFWSGGAWLEHRGKQALIFVGRHGLGEEYYGEGKVNQGACSEAKGFHAHPYETRILWYDPNDVLDSSRDRIDILSGTIDVHILLEVLD